MASAVCPTPGFRKLLVATDGSLYSKAAIDEALKLAKACKSHLTVLSVIEVGPEYEFWDPQFLERWEQDIRRHLDDVSRRARKDKVLCKTVVFQSDEPYREIVSEAKKRKVDTIILGSHGRTGLKRLMMGSVATRVVGHAPCKVLIGPAKRKK